MIKNFLTDFEEIALRLQHRKLNRSQLLVIKNKLEKRNQLISVVNQWKKEKKQLSVGPQNAQMVNNLKREGEKKKQQLEALEDELKKLTDQIPNLIAREIPLKENRIVDEEKFIHKIDHGYTYEQIAKKLAIVDEKAGVKLSGSKFVVYQGLGTKLIHSLINFMLAEQEKRGYQLFTVPYLVQEQNLYHTGQLPKFQEDLFKINNSNLYLIPTAEVSLMNLYQNEILDEKKLPLKLCSYSSCFRAEAGAAGQENKGLIRLHQFHKVELVRIVKPEDSYLHLEKIVEDARNILRLLEIPHRVVELCTEELGFSSAKTYDLEIWLPVSKKWIEISSCSNCEDFQTERAKIRVRKENNQKYYPHSLNGSGLAIDRLITALLEYYYSDKQNKLELPKSLSKYFF